MRIGSGPVNSLGGLESLSLTGGNSLVQDLLEEILLLAQFPSLSLFLPV